MPIRDNRAGVLTIVGSGMILLRSFGRVEDMRESFRNPMYRLVPEFIQIKFAAGETAGTFQSIALFVDISGFTPLTETLMRHGQDGAEVLARITKDVLEPLIQSVFEHGGFVTGLAGDAFTALFPADAHKHALAAAWRARHTMAISGQKQTAYGDFAIAVKIGMAVGHVAWGILSSDDKSRAAYYFQGPVIDGCAFSEKLAQSGDIIVSPELFKAIGSAVSADPVGDHFRITAVYADLPQPQPFELQPVDPDITASFGTWLACLSASLRCARWSSSRSSCASFLACKIVMAAF
jgi:class 3 adenylate cyclase